MANYLPPKIPLTPKQAAAQRARRIATALNAAMWIAAAIPLLFMLMAFGYSDQAPAFLRSVTIALDGLFGGPVWMLIGPKS